MDGGGGAMTVPVALDRLRAAVEERGDAAYLLTVSDDGRPHAVHGRVEWDDDRLSMEVGKRSAANATARSSVSLLYPIRTADDYSLIIDGTAALASTGGANRVLVTPTRAVLHRPSPPVDPTSSCGADCVPLVAPPQRGQR